MKLQRKKVIEKLAMSQEKPVLGRMLTMSTAAEKVKTIYSTGVSHCMHMSAMVLVYLSGGREKQSCSNRVSARTSSDWM